METNIEVMNILYLLPTIYEEVIAYGEEYCAGNIEGIEVRQVFFSFLYLYAQHNARRQVNLYLRCVLPNWAVERFVAFIPIYLLPGNEIAKLVLNCLAESDINIKDCRGQSYD